MDLPPELADREMLIFAGKGGVGKTTTSSAAALALAGTGKRVLLVTVDPAKRLKDALGVDVGHRPTEVADNLWAMMLDPERTIEEYLREAHPDQNLTDHPMYRYLSNYMPGVNELIAIGQLIEFREEKDFDVIVVDTAPTGHALSFLSTPLALRDLFQENTMLKWAIWGYGVYRRLAKGGRAITTLFGGKDAIPPAPEIDFKELFDQISEQVGKIHALLSDHAKTSLIIVTLPERLPVEETVELHGYITSKLNIAVPMVIVNKVQPDPLEADGAEFSRLRGDPSALDSLRDAAERAGYPASLVDGMVRATEFNGIRREMNLANLAILGERLPTVPKVILPLHKNDISGMAKLSVFQAELLKGLSQD